MARLKTKENIEEINLKIRRKRWRNVAAIYLILLIFSILFMGPFLFGAISSLKDNPVEWPPTLKTAQLSPKNWIGAYRVARQGGGGGFFGCLKPGHNVSFRATYLYPDGKEITPPQARVSKRLAGYGKSAFELDKKFAVDYIEVKSVEEIERQKTDKGTKVIYEITLTNPSQYTFDKVPVDVQVPYKVKFVEADFEPNRLERLGMVQSWDNIVSGTIPYIFHNYHRVFNENYSRTTGRSLFLTWIFNSFFLSITRVITTIIVASMAGYVLARLNFAGKKVLFILVLFSMMIPLQVTFVSNYLVLRDGIFGLTKLFGVDTLLNSLSGVIIWGMVAGNSVFIMKQFFEGLPKSLEESARIDGASTYTIFSRIMLPLAKPALGALTILTFQGAWNDFFLPLVVITSPMDRFPLTVGLLSFRRIYGAGGMDWGPVLAGAIISALPIIILFVVFQRYFVEGISFSGMKG
ncbi:carbohydrate ABC transporter permease [Halothermothrix orenii]|uniref:Binding-protein-dependent transport systems inner membrane component n=1 Tax=Halothermothrix orenii (strain H 168 / OCM 544 / DSM 9562) TaxID=373903 RepID=B8D047_HALOH|nr:carbohydrate ABC transporter permease [Halothermothrix orenii]ACL68801.1 binding-protein-dependent transport systems inner membrane component [Halothermothrix orenii H 168]